MRHGREGGQERANYVSFLNELIALLELPPPDPADATHENNDYVFERAVRKHKDEGDSHGRIDLYKKNSFVLEAKQSRLKGVKKVAGQNDLFTAEIPEDSRGRRGADRAWDVLMLNAKRQAEEYARALPTSHGWPPFILVCDVGHCIEVYADFSGQGKNYTQFPDRQSFRIYLEDLRIDEVRERLRRIWLDPASLDPAQTSAKVTRDIAKRLAQVSLALEKKNFPAPDVAMFLMRCLFTMFAEDVGLLPEKSFKEVLEECEKNPEAFTHDVSQLWEAMDLGTWAHVLKSKVKKFNGEFSAITRRCRLAVRKSASCGRPRATAGKRSIHRSSARWLNRRSTRRSAIGSAHITHRALMSSGWWSRPSSSPCARTGAMCKPRRKPSAPPATSRARRPRCRRFMKNCARRGCSIPPAAPAIFSTSRWN